MVTDEELVRSPEDFAEFVSYLAGTASDSENPMAHQFLFAACRFAEAQAANYQFRGEKLPPVQSETWRVFAHLMDSALRLVQHEAEQRGAPDAKHGNVDENANDYDWDSLRTLLGFAASALESAAEFEVGALVEIADEAEYAVIKMAQANEHEEVLSALRALAPVPAGTLASSARLDPQVSLCLRAVHGVLVGVRRVGLQDSVRRAAMASSVAISAALLRLIGEKRWSEFEATVNNNIDLPGLLRARAILDGSP